jgi:hypothetical protein
VADHRHARPEENAMPLSDWRSPTAYKHLSGLTPARLAWEFLRRNPEYRSDYQRADGYRGALGTGSEAVCDDLARRWGLRFLGRPRPKR